MYLKATRYKNMEWIQMIQDEQAVTESTSE
jgi:hypothetical protein